MASIRVNNVSAFSWKYGAALVKISTVFPRYCSVIFSVYKQESTPRCFFNRQTQFTAMNNNKNGVLFFMQPFTKRQLLLSKVQLGTFKLRLTIIFITLLQGRLQRIQCLEEYASYCQTRHAMAVAGLYIQPSRLSDSSNHKR